MLDPTFMQTTVATTSTASAASTRPAPNAAATTSAFGPATPAGRPATARSTAASLVGTVTGPTLIRTATVAGALSLIAEGLLELVEPQRQPLTTLSDHLIEAGFAAGLLLTLAGYVGLHLRQERAAGALSLWGMRAAVAGQGTLGLIALASLVRGGDVLGPLFGIGLLLWVGGTAAFAVATARAGVLPRWAGAGLLVALLASFLVGPGGTVIIGAAWLAAAVALLGDRSVHQPQAA